MMRWTGKVTQLGAVLEARLTLLHQTNLEHLQDLYHPPLLALKVTVTVLQRWSPRLSSLALEALPAHAAGSVACSCKFCRSSCSRGRRMWIASPQSETRLRASCRNSLPTFFRRVIACGGGLTRFYHTIYNNRANSTHRSVIKNSNVLSCCISVL